MSEYRIRGSYAGTGAIPYTNCVPAPEQAREWGATYMGDVYGNGGDNQRPNKTLSQHQLFRRHVFPHCGAGLFSPRPYRTPARHEYHSGGVRSGGGLVRHFGLRRTSEKVVPSTSLDICSTQWYPSLRAAVKPDPSAVCGTGLLRLVSQSE
jgi:hypothetical protein